MKVERWTERGRPKAVAYAGCCWIGSDSVMASDVSHYEWEGGRVVPVVVPVFFRIWKKGVGAACQHGGGPSVRVRRDYGKAAAKELMGAEFHDFIDKPW